MAGGNACLVQSYLQMHTCSVTGRACAIESQSTESSDQARAHWVRITDKGCTFQTPRILVCPGKVDAADLDIQTDFQSKQKRTGVWGINWCCFCYCAFFALLPWICLSPQ